MKTLETQIEIDASPQTVWGILDDLARYPEWNKLAPNLTGRTTVGQVVTGDLVQPNTPVIPLAPVLTRIVGARELRWLTVVPGDQGFSAEHYFILRPNQSGGTHLVHNENFSGPAVSFMWEGIDTNARQAYNQMNVDLKARAESVKSQTPALHPTIDSGVSVTKSATAEMTLRCRCGQDPVKVQVGSAITHNHLCGCSRCWKPEGALFAQTAVVPVDALAVTANAGKLKVIDPSQSIRRHACTGCGVHLFGRVDDPDHHFYGVAFVHPELAEAGEPPAPEFAGFVSSIIESGAMPWRMEAVRNRLKSAGIPAYDGFSPEIMDIIAWHKVKLARAIAEP